MKTIYIAYEGETLEGVFTDKQMAEKWESENKQRKLVTANCLDKTFSQLSVEYNNSYEG